MDLRLKIAGSIAATALSCVTLGNCSHSRIRYRHRPGSKQTQRTTHWSCVQGLAAWLVPGWGPWNRKSTPPYGPNGSGSTFTFTFTFTFICQSREQHTWQARLFTGLALSRHKKKSRPFLYEIAGNVSNRCTNSPWTSRMKNELLYK